MKINIQMILDGLEQGLVRLVLSPFGDGVVCQIGDNWFYFSEDLHNSTVEEYLSSHTVQERADQILIALNEGILELDEEEYLYYYWFLLENLAKT